MCVSNFPVHIWTAAKNEVFTWLSFKPMGFLVLFFILIQSLFFYYLVLPFICFNFELLVFLQTFIFISCLFFYMFSFASFHPSFFYAMIHVRLFVLQINCTFLHSIEMENYTDRIFY